MESNDEESDPGLSGLLGDYGDGPSSRPSEASCIGFGSNEPARAGSIDDPRNRSGIMARDAVPLGWEGRCRRAGVVRGRTRTQRGPAASSRGLPTGSRNHMAARLGPSWLNRVQQLAGPTHAGRLGRYAVLVDRINALEPAMEACS